jgi:hypothetical protein
LHEVMKYTELLQRERGIERSNIRAVIISTHWTELRVPFSHFKRGWSNEIRGYALTLEEDEITPVRAVELTALADAPARGISPIHLVVFPRGSVTLDEIWQESIDKLRKVGADDLLGIELSHDDDSRILYHSCLYLVIGTMVPDDPRTALLDEWAEEVPDDTIEAPGGYALEYRALCHLTSQYDYDKVEIETAGPEGFAAIRFQRWKIHHVRRAGIFGRQEDLYPDEVLLAKMVHRGGQSPIRFSGSSRPANHVHFADFRRNMGRCLTAAGTWRDSMTAWLDDAAKSPDADISCNIYSPCDFIQSIVLGWPDRVGEYLPFIRAIVDVPSSSCRTLVGTLTWNGKLAQVLDAIHSVYAEPFEWTLAVTLGCAWIRDPEVLEKLNLAYSLIEWSDEHKYGSILSLANGHLVRTPTTSLLDDGRPVFESVWPVQDFFRAHVNEIRLIANEFRSSTDLAL